MLPFHERIDQVAHHGRAAQAAAYPYAKVQYAIALDRLQADVVHPHGGAVFFCAAECNLEFARQERASGAQRGSLSDRSEGRRLGKAWFSTGSSRCRPYPSQQPLASARLLAP